MLYIVIEKSMGFGGGGWDTGYYIYLIRDGKIIKTIEIYDIEPILGTLKFVLKAYDIKYKIHKVDYPPKGDDFCKQLIKVLCKQSKKEMK